MLHCIPLSLSLWPISVCERSFCEVIKRRVMWLVTQSLLEMKAVLAADVITMGMAAWQSRQRYGKKGPPGSVSEAAGWYCPAATVAPICDKRARHSHRWARARHAVLSLTLSCPLPPSLSLSFARTQSFAISLHPLLQCFFLPLCCSLTHSKTHKEKNHTEQIPLGEEKKNFPSPPECCHVNAIVIVTKWR